MKKRYLRVGSIMFVILLGILLYTMYISRDEGLSYTVENGTIHVKPEDEQYEKAWLRIKELLPSAYVPYIKKFSIRTDGIDGNLASIAPLDDNNKTFDLEIDPADVLDEKGEVAKNSDVKHTFIHEYMHIVTLCDKQMQFGEIKDQDTLVITEGTTKKSAYLNVFYSRFWRHLAERLQEMEEAVIDPDKAEQIAIEIYNQDPSAYVSEYAATNPVEDIAEAFAKFVLEDKPAGDDVKDKKIRFFYEFDELVALRDAFRTRLN